MPLLDPSLYTVAWIAPLEIEAQAAWHILDDKHDGRFPVGRGDDYVFRGGSIHGHNIIIATLPAGQEYGTGSAAALASQVKTFFPNLWFGLLVGVAAGLPNLSLTPPRDIRLGDILVALPEGDSAGLVAYELGKETSENGFKPLRPGHLLASTETVVRSAIGSLKLHAPNEASLFSGYYESLETLEHRSGTFEDPGQEHDELYETTASGGYKPVLRDPRPTSRRNRVWYGPIGSGDKLLKDAQRRDELRDKHGVIGLEMEAAGTMNRIPVGVIRGVCDYGDVHKNKQWQPYAAAMAAAYAKALLHEIPPRQIRTRRRSIVSTAEFDKCIRLLRSTDPRHDKSRIEHTKGGLLKEAYWWILTHPKFVHWRDDPSTNLLWIQGDPGKGKTMLLSGIIDELGRSININQAVPVAFFFCQSTDNRLNSAKAVLRGLAYLLVDNRPSLVSHVQKQYSQAGEELLEGINGLFAISEILSNILQDPELQGVFLVVDALDECEADLPQLLRFIHHTSTFPKVKWVVSSRHKNEIGRELQQDVSCVSLELRENAEQVSDAVDSYITHCVSEMATLRNEDDLRSLIHHELRNRAHGTFLWVSLVAQELREAELWELQDILQELPADLEGLFHRMLHQIGQGKPRNQAYCRLLLTTIITTYRPLTLKELGALARLPEAVTRSEGSVESLVRLCGSFLTIREDQVYIIHQSARDFLITTASLLPKGIASEHDALCMRSIELMEATFRYNMYNLAHSGVLIDEIHPPKQDPLAALRYSCIYWVHHLNDSCPSDKSRPADKNFEMANGFLKSKLLYWLEALGLMSQATQGIVSMLMLHDIFLKEHPMQLEMAADTMRFLKQYRNIIDLCPLQVYVIAEMFAPSESTIRGLIYDHGPRLERLVTKPKADMNWTACLQTLEGHEDTVTLAIFSPKSDLIASASLDRTIRIWDVTTGLCAHILTGLKDYVQSLAFSPDSSSLMAVTAADDLKMWATKTGECLITVPGFGHSAKRMNTPNGQILASFGVGPVVKLYQALTGACLHVIHAHNHIITSLSFSKDSSMMATSSSDRTIGLWNVLSGREMGRFEGHTGTINTVCFSLDAKQILSSSDDGTVRVWDVETGSCIGTYKDHTAPVRSATFSLDARLIASASEDTIVKVWDTMVSHDLYNDDRILSMEFSPDESILVSFAAHYRMKIWDTDTGEVIKSMQSSECVAFSPDSQSMALSNAAHDRLGLLSARRYLEIGRLRDKIPGFLINLPTVKWLKHPGNCSSKYHIPLMFSPDSKFIVSLSSSEEDLVSSWSRISQNLTVHGRVGLRVVSLSIHDTDSAQETLREDNFLSTVTFSPDSRQVAFSDRYGGTIRIFDPRSGRIISTVQVLNGKPGPVVYSPDSKMFTSLCAQSAILTIWCAQTMEILQILSVTEGRPRKAVFSADCSKLTVTMRYRRLKYRTTWEIATGEVVAAEGVDQARMDCSTKKQQKTRYRISEDNMWVVCEDRKLIWLPPHRRPGIWTSASRTIATGSGTGRVTLFKFAESSNHDLPSNSSRQVRSTQWSLAEYQSCREIQ